VHQSYITFFICDISVIYSSDVKISFFVFSLCVGQDSTVIIVTLYRLDGLGIES